MATSWSDRADVRPWNASRGGLAEVRARTTTSPLVSAIPRLVQTAGPIRASGASRRAFGYVASSIARGSSTALGSRAPTTTSSRSALSRRRDIVRVTQRTVRSRSAVVCSTMLTRRASRGRCCAVVQSTRWRSRTVAVQRGSSSGASAARSSSTRDTSGIGAVAASLTSRSRDSAPPSVSSNPPTSVTTSSRATNAARSTCSCASRWSRPPSTARYDASSRRGIRIAACAIEAPSASRWPSITARKSGCQVWSGSTNATYFPRARARAALRARARPPRGTDIGTTRGSNVAMPASTAVVSSAEPSSTTTSSHPPYDWAWTVSTTARSRGPSSLTARTTVTRGSSPGSGSAGGAGCALGGCFVRRWATRTSSVSARRSAASRAAPRSRPHAISGTPSGTGTGESSRALGDPPRQRAVRVPGGVGVLGHDPGHVHQRVRRGAAPGGLVQRVRRAVGLGLEAARGGVLVGGEDRAELGAHPVPVQQARGEQDGDVRGHGGTPPGGATGPGRAASGGASRWAGAGRRRRCPR